jgi:cell division transport system ATP-binding protein
LAIARAIVNRPAILIADEPTASLDRETARRIMSVFKDFNRVGVTTLIASHDDDLMAEYATRAFKIDPGRFADSADRRVPANKSTVSNQSPERNEPSLGEGA